jgi:hypothetical protein
VHERDSGSVDGMNWRGNWLSAVTYSPGDAVVFGDHAHLCTAKHLSTNQNAPFAGTGAPWSPIMSASASSLGPPPAPYTKQLPPPVADPNEQPLAKFVKELEATHPGKAAALGGTIGPTTKAYIQSLLASPPPSPGPPLSSPSPASSDSTSANFAKLIKPPVDPPGGAVEGHFPGPEEIKAATPPPLTGSIAFGADGKPKSVDPGDLSGEVAQAFKDNAKKLSDPFHEAYAKGFQDTAKAVSSPPLQNIPPPKPKKPPTKWSQEGANELKELWAKENAKFEKFAESYAPYIPLYSTGKPTPPPSSLLIAPPPTPSLPGDSSAAKIEKPLMDQLIQHYLEKYATATGKPGLKQAVAAYYAAESETKEKLKKEFADKIGMDPATFAAMWASMGGEGLVSIPDPAPIPKHLAITPENGPAKKSPFEKLKNIYFHPSFFGTSIHDEVVVDQPPAKIDAKPKKESIQEKEQFGKPLAEELLGKIDLDAHIMDMAKKFVKYGDAFGPLQPQPFADYEQMDPYPDLHGTSFVEDASSTVHVIPPLGPVGAVVHHIPPELVATQFPWNTYDKGVMTTVLDGAAIVYIPDANTWDGQGPRVYVPGTSSLWGLSMEIVVYAISNGVIPPTMPSDFLSPSQLLTVPPPAVQPGSETVAAKEPEKPETAKEDASDPLDATLPSFSQLKGLFGGLQSASFEPTYGSEKGMIQPGFKLEPLDFAPDPAVAGAVPTPPPHHPHPNEVLLGPTGGPAIDAGHEKFAKKAIFFHVPVGQVFFNDDLQLYGVKTSKTGAQYFTSGASAQAYANELLTTKSGEKATKYKGYSIIHKANGKFVVTHPKAQGKPVSWPTFEKAKSYIDSTIVAPTLPPGAVEIVPPITDGLVGGVYKSVKIDSQKGDTVSWCVVASKDISYKFPKIEDAQAFSKTLVPVDPPSEDITEHYNGFKIVHTKEGTFTVLKPGTTLKLKSFSSSADAHAFVDGDTWKDPKPKKVFKEICCITKTGLVLPAWCVNEFGLGKAKVFKQKAAAIKYLAEILKKKAKHPSWFAPKTWELAAQKKAELHPETDIDLLEEIEEAAQKAAAPTPVAPVAVPAKEAFAALNVPTKTEDPGATSFLAKAKELGAQLAATIPPKKAETDATIANIASAAMGFGKSLTAAKMVAEGQAKLADTLNKVAASKKAPVIDPVTLAPPVKPEEPKSDLEKEAEALVELLPKITSKVVQQDGQWVVHDGQGGIYYFQTEAQAFAFVHKLETAKKYLAEKGIDPEATTWDQAIEHIQKFKEAAKASGIPLVVSTQKKAAQESHNVPIDLTKLVGHSDAIAVGSEAKAIEFKTVQAVQTQVDDHTVLTALKTKDFTNVSLEALEKAHAKAMDMNLMSTAKLIMGGIALKKVKTIPPKVKQKGHFIKKVEEAKQKTKAEKLKGLQPLIEAGNEMAEAFGIKDLSAMAKEDLAKEKLAKEVKEFETKHADEIAEAAKGAKELEQGLLGIDPGKTGTVKVVVDTETTGFSKDTPIAMISNEAAEKLYPGFKQLNFGLPYPATKAHAQLQVKLAEALAGVPGIAIDSAKLQQMEAKLLLEKAKLIPAIPAPGSPEEKALIEKVAVEFAKELKIAEGEALIAEIQASAHDLPTDVAAKLKEAHQKLAAMKQAKSDVKLETTKAIKTPKKEWSDYEKQINAEIDELVTQFDAKGFAVPVSSVLWLKGAYKELYDGQIKEKEFNAKLEAFKANVYPKAVTPNSVSIYKPAAIPPLAEIPPSKFTTVKPSGTVSILGPAGGVMYPHPPTQDYVEKLLASGHTSVIEHAKFVGMNVNLDQKLQDAELIQKLQDAPVKQDIKIDVPATPPKPVSPKSVAEALADAAMTPDMLVGLVMKMAAIGNLWKLDFMSGRRAHVSDSKTYKIEYSFLPANPADIHGFWIFRRKVGEPWGNPIIQWDRKTGMGEWDVENDLFAFVAKMAPSAAIAYLSSLADESPF